MSSVSCLESVELIEMLTSMFVALVIQKRHLRVDMGKCERGRPTESVALPGVICEKLPEEFSPPLCLCVINLPLPAVTIYEPYIMVS